MHHCKYCNKKCSTVIQLTLPKNGKGDSSAATHDSLVDTSAVIPKPRDYRINSADLFGVTREIIIEHAGNEYRLRLTRQDKLILTK